MLTRVRKAWRPSKRMQVYVAVGADADFRKLEDELLIELKSARRDVCDQVQWHV